MNRFTEIPAESIPENLFELIGKNWMLITAGNKEKLNTMTASWGGTGVLWRKNVAFIFVRPQRYTKEFLDKRMHFSLNFFDGFQRELQFCGTKSGRECDKIAATGLTPIFDKRTPYFEQAKMVLLCKKMYRQQLNAESIIDTRILNEYQNGDFHYMYVGEIKKVLISSNGNGAVHHTIPRELMFN